MSFEIINDFEKEIANFFGAKFAVAVDSCTHGVELCLRYTKSDKIKVPKHTYLSIPFLSEKLKIKLEWKDEDWVDYYLSNPSLQDLITYQNIKFTYPKSFIHASELSENHDFYGIMDSRKSLSKSLHIISQKTNMLFCLNNNFNYYSPMDNFTYKRKEIESVLEKDIYFFNQKKEALKSL